MIGSKYSDTILGRHDTNDTIWGNQGSDNIRGLYGNDQIFGGAGNDVICGDQGNDYLSGGSGHDYYWFYTGDGNDTIADSEEFKSSYKNIQYKSKLGSVLVDGIRLTGGEYSQELNSYLAYESGITYQWSGINNTDLIVKYGNNDSIVIKGFSNGNLGIVFDRSIILDKNNIANQLTRNKQVPLDLLKDAGVTPKGNSYLQYFDTAANKRYRVISCETTEKLLKSYGYEIVGAQLDADGKYMLIEEGQKIILRQKPVDNSSLVEDMKNTISGIQKEQKDLAIQTDIYIPTSSTEGSPTLQDVYYQYTTKPSGGGILSGIFTLLSIGISLVTQNWWGAAMIALETGIAGNKVGKIASITDLVFGAVRQITNIKNLSGIFTVIGSKEAIINTGNSFATGFAADVVQHGAVMGEIAYDASAASKWSFKSVLEKNYNSSSFSGVNILNVLVNQTANPKSSTSDVYTVDTFTGNISGGYEIPSSNVTDPDTSTPTTTQLAQISVDRGCPLVLDLSGDGLKTLNIDDTNIYFNTKNSDFSTKTGWISKYDAFLAIDKDNDGKITRQDELFGTETQSGFDVLKNYDSNKDGIINSADSAFGQLRIWQDLNENGITDEGELKTLSQAGIASIKLNSVKINDEQNNNTITGMSTFTKTDGTVLHIYNVNLAFNKMYTQYNGTYALSADVLDMPWLRGYGQVCDLQLAMSENEDLKNFVKELSNMDDAKQIYDKMDELLAKWIGCEDIQSSSTQNGINSREIAILNKYLGLDLQGEVGADKKVFMDSAYQSLKNKIYTSFIAQTQIGNAFEINYDYKTDSILYNDNTYENLITNLPDQKNFFASYIIAKVLNDSNCLDGNKLAYTITEKGYGASLISYLNSGFQILEDGNFEILNPNTPMYVIGTSGDDVIVGTDNADIIYGMDGDDILNGGAGDDYLSGGRGNDTLIGGDGNDTLDGGDGDDSLEGGYGNDTYIYDGSGKDTIIDERWIKIARQEWYQSGFWIFKRWKSRWVYQDKLVDAGQDTIVFGENVTAKDVDITRNGNDLILSLIGTDNKLTIKDWYTTSEQRVEKFVFEDGFIVNSDQIINLIKDTSLSENLSGTSKPNFIISSAGNDTINAAKGDDAIINFEGDTTYIFNAGGGNDVIADYAGNDKIKFGSGIGYDDVKYTRHNQDLVISVNNMDDSITIINWFKEDSNKIETIEFSDGRTLSPDDILAMLSTTVATGYDDVIIGNDEENLIDGLAGNDYIEGGKGNDTIIGGLGKDIMKGGEGNDSYYVDNAGDEVIEAENEGNDTIYSSISYELPDNVENLTLIGSGNINAVGNSLDNVITGNDGDNIIDGVSGTNTLYGGKGNDTYIINESNKNDVIVENLDEGSDTVQSTVTYGLGANIENLVLAGENEINGNGNNLDNYIQGNSANNVLMGGAGKDILYGNGGNDTLIGGTGDDTYLVDAENIIVTENANEGTDTVISLIDYTLGANLENLELAGYENLSGYGNSLNNIITGNDGDNILCGHGGRDTLQAGKGSDTYLFNAGDGQDTIIENDDSNICVDTIKFGEGITKDDIVLTKTGFDLIITFKNNSTDKITIKNSNIDKSSRIEHFEFSDGTIFDARQLYIKYADDGSSSLYSDVNYLNVNSKASAIDREYDDFGNLLMERTYNENGYVSKEVYYYSNGREQIVRNYNSLGQLLDESNYYKTNYLKSKQVCEYNAENKLVKELDYLGNSDNIAVLQNTTVHSYNSKGLLDKSIIYRKSYGSDVVDKTIFYTYDSLGRINKKDTYLGPNNVKLLERTQYTYNQNGDTINIHTQIGYDKHIGLNLDGSEKTERALRTGDNITYIFDSNNKILKETVISGYPIEHTYTSQGKTYTYNTYDTRMTSETIYGYDSSGNLKSKNTTVGYYQESATAGGITQTWQYRPLEEITYQYSNGNLVKEIINRSYNEQVTSTLGGRQYTYTVYRMRKQSETTYSYDSSGRMTYMQKVVGYNKRVPTPDKLDSVWAYITDEEHTYSYNANGQLELDSKSGSYYKYVSEKSGTTTYHYYKRYTDKISETKYVYDKYCRVSEINTYKSTSDVQWVAGLYEQLRYTYDANGRVTLTELRREGKLVEVLKYGYTLDENGYLYKQTISKGVISNNTVTSYKQIDEVIMNSYYNNLNGSGESDTLTGANQNDELFGNGGNDILYGNTGDDILDGGAGADLMVGGLGNDTYFVDNKDDKIIEYKDEGIDTVNVTFSYTLEGNFENLNLLADNNINGKGNSADNLIQGNSGNNALYGLAGDDILYGGKGNDSLYGGIEDDVYLFSQGDGKDMISDDAGVEDSIQFDNTVDSSSIAIFQDGNNLIIDYGNTAGTDVITINNQSLENNAIERIQLSDGKYLSDTDINKIIQNMMSYATNNEIEFTNIESVKNNENLMNLVSSSWHS